MNEGSDKVAFANLLNRFKLVINDMTSNSYDLEKSVNKIKLSPPEKEACSSEKDLTSESFYDELVSIISSLEYIQNKNANTLNKLNSLF